MIDIDVKRRRADNIKSDYAQAHSLFTLSPSALRLPHFQLSVYGGHQPFHKDVSSNCLFSSTLYHKLFIAATEKFHYVDRKSDNTNEKTFVQQQTHTQKM